MKSTRFSKFILIASDFLTWERVASDRCQLLGASTAPWCSFRAQADVSRLLDCHGEYFVCLFSDYWSWGGGPAGASFPKLRVPGGCSS